MPAPEETSIVLQFQDGQPELTLDAIDVDRIVLAVNEKDIPEDSSFEEEFAKVFRRKYNRKLSRSAVMLLCRIKMEKLELVKKNLFMQDGQSDSSEQDISSPNETSNSSVTSNQPSEQ